MWDEVDQLRQLSDVTNSPSIGITETKFHQITNQELTVLDIVLFRGDKKTEKRDKVRPNVPTYLVRWLL